MDLKQTLKVGEEEDFKELEALRSLVPHLEKQVSELEQSQKFQAAMYQIADVVSDGGDMTDIFRAIHKIINNLMYAENFFIVLYSDERESVFYPYFVNNEERFIPTYLPVDEFKTTVAGQICTLGEAKLFTREEVARVVKGSCFKLESVCPLDWLGAPIKKGEEIFGAIVVQNYKESDRYTEADKELFVFISQHLATVLVRRRDALVIKNARDELERRVDERTHELSLVNNDLLNQVQERKRAQALYQALYKIAGLANKPGELRQFYEAVHGILKGLMYAENCFIAVFSDDGKSVSFPYVVDLYDEVLVDELPSSMPADIFLDTLTGYVVKTKKTFLASGKDLQRMGESGECAMVGSIIDDWISWLGAPLEHDEQILGVIVVQSYEKSIDYSEADTELITFVARHIATALFNKRAKNALKYAHVELENRVQARTNELSVINQQLEKQIYDRKRAEKLQNTLYRIAELSNYSIEPENFYRALHEIINELMYAENFYIAILNKEESTLEFPYAVDKSGEKFKTLPIEMGDDGNIKGEGLSIWVINTGESLLLSTEDFKKQVIPAVGNDPTAWLGVPLMLENKPWGMLAVQSYEADIGFNADDERLLIFVSGHIATALNRKHGADLLSQAHKELGLINSELEARVRQRTVELTDMNLALNKALEKQENTQKIQSALYQIAEVTAISKDLEELYRSIHYIVASLMYVRNFYIALYDDDNRMVTFPYLIDEYENDWVPAVPKDEFNNTLTGYVARTAEPLLASRSEIERMQADGCFKVMGHMMVDWMGVPLMRGDSVLGVLAVQSYDESVRYNESHKEILTFVSQHIAAGLIRKSSEQQLKKAHEDLERRVEQRTQELSLANLDLEKQIDEREKAKKLQSALYRIADLSTQPIKLEEFYRVLHHIMSELMYAENFYIALKDSKTHDLEFSYVADKYGMLGPGKGTAASVDLTQMQEYNHKVLRLLRPLLISRDKTDSYHLSASALNLEMYSWLGVPLVSEGRSIGVLSVLSYSDEILFGKKDKELLTFVSQHISAALQHKRDSMLLQAAHKELQEINDELEARVSKRTHELSDANRQLQDMLEARKQIEKKLAHDACHDALTDLPNRTLFLDRLDNAIKRNLRNSEVGFAVLFLDLDRFKIVNDSLGHLEGDFLLREVGARLERCVRPGDTVARLGGDEFSILIDGSNGEEMAVQVAQRVLDICSEPFSIGDQTLFVSTSIGITLSESGYKDPEDVLRDADAAMYHAKAQGKAQYAMFDCQMRERAVNRLKLENELRLAVEQNQVEIFYQPIVNIQTGEVAAFEALARWDHKELGSISPAEFIPIAEETGLISKLGFIVLEKAAEQVRLWRALDPDYEDIEISVNISPKQIAEPDFFEKIMDVYAKNQLPHDAIKFEITESLLIHNFDVAKDLLDKLYNENIKVMLDDFGTGYSSLSYLHHFPLASLKIDRSFVMNLHTRRENKEIVRTIKTLAESLNMLVVAEGVETKEQLETLVGFGIEFGQGFYFSKALKMDEAELFIKENISALRPKKSVSL